jgi:hypothetical protein
MAKNLLSLYRDTPLYQTIRQLLEIISVPLAEAKAAIQSRRQTDPWIGPAPGAAGAVGGNRARSFLMNSFLHKGDVVYMDHGLYRHYGIYNNDGV